MAQKILVVDDEKDLVELLEYNLRKEGFTVTSASDGLEALKMAVKESPDLIILDVMLPGMQGMEIIKRLREKQETAQTPVIFLTARVRGTRQGTGA